MRIYFTVLRKAIAALALALLLAIIGNVVAQFFIGLAQEHGLYNTPSERVGYVMNAFSSFLGQTWVFIASAFLCGVSLGFYLDLIFRKYERLKLPEGSGVTLSALSIDTPAGVLDFLADGLQALNDITKINQNMTKDTDAISKIIQRYKPRVEATTDFNRRRNLTRKLAGDFSAYSDKIENHAKNISKSGNLVEVNCGEYIKIVPIVTQADKDALIRFSVAQQGGLNATMQMVTTIRETRQSMMSNLFGVSRDLNVAINKVTGSYDRLISELNGYCEILKRIEEACSNKIVEIDL